MQRFGAESSPDTVEWGVAMHPIVNRLAVILACVGMLLAGVPASLGMACVAPNGRVVDICPEGGHHRAMAPVAACCCQHFAQTASCGRSIAAEPLHCALIARAAPRSPFTFAAGILMPAVGLAWPTHPVAPAATVIRGANRLLFPDGADPPLASPRAPDLGRAPPHS